MSITIQTLEAEFNRVSFVKIADDLRASNLEKLWKLALDNYFPEPDPAALGETIYPVLYSEKVSSKSIFEQKFSDALSRLKQDGTFLGTLSPVMRASREVVYYAVKQNGEALQHADEALKKDPAIAYIAVKHAHNALNYANESLQNNKAFLDATEISSPFYFNVLMSLLCSASVAIAIIGLLISLPAAPPALAAVGICMTISGVAGACSFFTALSARSRHAENYVELGASCDTLYAEPSFN